jgi:GDP-L-fucose synthase
MVGSVILRNLYSRGFNNIITRTHSEFDLTNQKSVDDFFVEQKPEYVVLAAAKVGGIYANNKFPEFIYK